MSQQLGWLDTNIVVHTLHRRDPQFARCVEILAELESGQAEAWIDPLVVHELTYVLGQHLPFGAPDDVPMQLRAGRIRETIYHYLRTILEAPSVHAVDKPIIMEALADWNTRGIGFVDAWLGARARHTNLPVCSVNRKDFRDVENTF